MRSIKFESFITCDSFQLALDIGTVIREIIYLLSLILGQAVGPVIVSEEISSKAKVGWTVYLVVGKTGKTWKPLAVGSVYPMFERGLGIS